MTVKWAERRIFREKEEFNSHGYFPVASPFSQQSTVLVQGDGRPVVQNKALC